MERYRILAAVRFLDAGAVNYVAALLEADLLSVVRSCRSLDREGYLDEVAPMTYRLSSEGATHLYRWLGDSEVVDADVFEGAAPDVDEGSSGNGPAGAQPPGVEYRVLTAVRYLDHAELRDVAPLAGTDTVTAFRTCRTLERADQVETVRPMTYRVTAAGVDRLDDWIERDAGADSEQFAAVTPDGVEPGVVSALVGDDQSFRSGPLEAGAPRQGSEVRTVEDEVADQHESDGRR